MLPLQILVFLTCCLLNTCEETRERCSGLTAVSPYSREKDICEIQYGSVANDELVEADKTQAETHIKGAHAYFSRRFFDDVSLHASSEVQKQLNDLCEPSGSTLNTALVAANMIETALSLQKEDKAKTKKENNDEITSHEGQYSLLKKQYEIVDERIKSTRDIRMAAYMLSSPKDKNKFWRNIFIHTFVNGSKVGDKCVASFQQLPLDLDDPRYINEIKAVLKIFSVGDLVPAAPETDIDFLRQVLVQSSLDSDTCEVHKHKQLPETIANAAYNIIQKLRPGYLGPNAYTLACQLKLLSLESLEKLPPIPKSVLKAELRSHFAADKFILGVSNYSEFVKKCKKHVNDKDNSMAWDKDFKEKRDGLKDAAVDCHCQLFLNEWLDELFVPHDEYSELGIFMILVPLGLCIFLIFYFTFHFCRR